MGIFRFYPVKNTPKDVRLGVGLFFFGGGGRRKIGVVIGVTGCNEVIFRIYPKTITPKKM